MQSDAFPTPPIYSHYFQPRWLSAFSEQEQPDQESSELSGDFHLHHLLNEIELLITDCSSEESKSFWMATNRIKIKYQVMEAMQKIENLLLDLAQISNQDPDLIASISAGLLYTSKDQGHLLSNSVSPMDIPQFLKEQLC